MQSSNPSVSENKISVAREFTSSKTFDVGSAWKKGAAFGFRDCEIWFGVKIESRVESEYSFTKHPLRDRYIKLVRQSESGLARQKQNIELKFDEDVKAIEYLDKNTFSSIVNKILEYDSYIHTIAEDIPEGQSISDYISSSFADDKKRLKIKENIPEFLLWIAGKLEKDSGSINKGSLILLIAMWIEVSNAVAWQHAGREEQGESYFCWEDVISSIDKNKAPKLKQKCSRTGKATKSRSDNKIKSIRKRKLEDQKEPKAKNKINYESVKKKSSPASGSGDIGHDSVETLPAKRRRVSVKEFDSKKMELKCDKQLSKLLQAAKGLSEETNKLFVLAGCSKVDDTVKRELIEHFLTCTNNINALKTRVST